MEKAFDRVWRDGLRIKLKQIGLSGKMNKWISHYLNNRKARTLVDGQYSRKVTLNNGVPQGGVLSPTLFLIFVNDLIKDLPRNVLAAMYADDLALWCTEEYLSTANYRLQESLNNMNSWTKKWLVRMNPEKTTHTVFTLSTVKQTANLYLDGEKLESEENPTYLGVTFDKRLTWKKQVEKSEKKAKSRLSLMKKIAGSSWGGRS